MVLYMTLAAAPEVCLFKALNSLNEGVKFSVSMGKIFFDKNQICIIVLSKFLVFCCRIIYLIIVLPIRLRLYLNFKIFCSTNSGISNPFFVGSAHTRPQE